MMKKERGCLQKINLLGVIHEHTCCILMQMWWGGVESGGYWTEDCLD